MAVPAGTFQTYQSIGTREDLEDTIYNISPTDTPFLSAIDKVSITRHIHEYQLDTLATATNTGFVEGDVASAGTSTPTVRIASVTQIFERVAQISTTQEAEKQAGRASELSYQLMKRGKDIVNSTEVAISQKKSQALATGTTVRFLGGAETWIKTNRVDNGTGTTPGYANQATGTVTDGTQVTFTEADLLTALGNAWTSGGEPDLIILGKRNKGKLDGFDGIATLQRDAGEKVTIVASADAYRSPYGTHKLQLSRFSRDRTVLVLDTNLWALGRLDSLRTRPLAINGLSLRREIYQEVTLISRNEAASSKVADRLTT